MKNWFVGLLSTLSIIPMTRNKKICGMRSCLLVLVTLFGGNACAFAESIKIATGEWEPYISKEYKHGGFIPHVIKEAFALEGIEAEFSFFPWARAVEYVNTGEFDAMAVTANAKAIAGKNHLYSDPVYIGEDVIFHHKSQPLEWQTFSDLHGLRFGAVFSYQYSDEYRQALKNQLIRETVATDDELLFRMLAAKRFDVFMMDRRVGEFLYETKLKVQLGDVITYFDKPIYTLDYLVRFSGDNKRSQRFQKAFNEGLQKLKLNGVYDKYLEQLEAGYYFGVE